MIAIEQHNDAPFWDGYLDWSRLMTARQGHKSGTAFEPIFVRLTGSDMPAARQRLHDLVAGPGDHVMETSELAHLTARLAVSEPFEGLEDVYPLYRVPGTSAPEGLWDVIDIGSDVWLDTPDAPPAPQMTACPRKGKPIVAVLDDGIGFLNRRFCVATDTGFETRFHAVWLQSRERGASDGHVVSLGRVLGKPQIDALLHGCEGSAYSALNAGLFGPDAHRSAEYATSHGTHVLDLAAGADPCDADDPARDWPLLAVQLPPEAIGDTSGTLFESYLVQGLRWVLAQASSIDAHAPVIVNISLGMLAGPKDGTRFAEYQIAREARFREMATGQPVRIVWSFGNNRRTRQCARLDYDAQAGRPNSDTDRHITWRVQPGDRTASFLEISPAAGQRATEFEVQLTSPDGQSSGFMALAPGSHVSMCTPKGAALARIYRNPVHDLGDGMSTPPNWCIAMAPTEAAGRPQAPTEAAGPQARTNATGPQAPAGAWRVSTRYGGSEPLQIVLQIQRDDTALGHWPLGRQSYFDDPAAYAEDAELHDTSGLDPVCAITRAGSHSALVTALAPGGGPCSARQVFSVGAATRGGAGADPVPSVYSAEGAADMAPGPILSTIADDGHALRGLLASGTLSGSARAIRGTSVAAACVSRALARSAAQIKANAAGAHLEDFDPTLVWLVPAPVEMAARLGQATINPVGPRDRR